MEADEGEEEGEAVGREEETSEVTEEDVEEEGTTMEEELSRTNILATYSILEAEERRLKQVEHLVLLEDNRQTKNFGCIASSTLPILENTKNELAKMIKTE